MNGQLIRFGGGVVTQSVCACECSTVYVFICVCVSASVCAFAYDSVCVSVDVDQILRAFCFLFTVRSKFVSQGRLLFLRGLQPQCSGSLF